MTTIDLSNLTPEAIQAFAAAMTADQLGEVLEAGASLASDKTAYYQGLEDNAKQLRKDSGKAARDAELADRLAKHTAASDGLRVANRTYLDTSYPDDGTPENPYQSGRMVIEWYRDADGRRVTVKMPEFKKLANGERQRGTDFMPLTAKLIFGASKVEANNAGMVEYLKWIGILNPTSSPVTRIKDEVLKLIDGKAATGSATADNLVIQHESINGGAATRMVDHLGALNAAKPTT
jgi:hypothetical protein